MDTQGYHKKNNINPAFRIKEQECLYNISCIDECNLSVGTILQKAVDYLPAGWQYPEITEAVIEFKGQTYQTVNFVETDWVIKSKISEPSSEPLSIKVAYQEKVPLGDEGPFLLEERQLIDSVTAILHQKVAHNELINELKEMYGLWNEAYDMAGIGHWSVDLINDNLFWSSAVKKIHEVPDGYEPDLESAINFYEEGTHRESIAKKVQKAIETGESFEAEQKIITAQGNERWIRAVGKSEFKNGKCIRIYGSTQNITERKVVENKLRAQKERLERAQKVAKMGDWEFIPATKQITWSPMTFEIFDLNPEQGPPPYEEIVSRYFGEDKHVLEEKIMKAATKAEPYDLVLHLTSGKGIKKYVRSIGFPMTDDSGQVVKILGVGQDVTDEMKIEVALRESEDRLRALTNNIPGLVFQYILSPNGDERVEYISEKSKEIFGFTPKEIMNNINLVWNRIHEGDIQRLRKSIAKSAVKLSTWNERWRFNKPGNDMRWLEGVGSPQKLNDGNYVWNTIILDITENVQLRGELKENERRLEAAIAGADLGVWDLNLKTGKNYTNTRWWEMLGYEPKEIEYTYASFLEMLHPEDKQKPAEVIERIENGSSDRFDITVRLRGKDGKYRTIKDRGKVVEFDENGRIVRMIGTHLNISEKVELMDKVVQSVIEGEDRERKRIARDLHDGIGQYLGASNMNFESVKHELNKLSPKSKNRFSRGLVLLKKAMEETRETAYKLMPEALEDYGLILALESLIENFEITSGINISFESAIEEFSMTKQVSINLYRIIQEALNNAVIHGECSNIMIRLYQTDHNINCIIRDDGIGMNLEDSDLGKGLGLQSMKFRAQSMSGTIYFESKPREGMTITLEIPVSKTNSI